MRNSRQQHLPVLAPTRAINGSKRNSIFFMRYQLMRETIQSVLAFELALSAGSSARSMLSVMRDV